MNKGYQMRKMFGYHRVDYLIFRRQNDQFIVDDYIFFLELK